MFEAGRQKICCTCGLAKSESDFNYKNRAVGRLHPFCRDCQHAWNREHYRRNKATYLANARRNNDSYRAENQRRLVEYLIDHPCRDCGERDPLVLDFDHRDPEVKRVEVANLIRHAASWTKVYAEIENCDVRCANCHRRRTAQQFRWRKLTLIDLVRQGRPDSNREPLVLETSALPIELRP